MGIILLQWLWLLHMNSSFFCFICGVYLVTNTVNIFIKFTSLLNIKKKINEKKKCFIFSVFFSRILEIKSTNENEVVKIT